MLGIHDFLIFLAAGLLLNITPGADMLYAVSNGAARGAKAGIAAALGIFAGTLVHIAFAIVGLSALLAASATAFTIIKYIGAAYLVYLGIGTSINIAAACSARVVGQRLPGAERYGFWLKKTVGGIFVALGARLALSGQR